MAYPKKQVTHKVQIDLAVQMSEFFADPYGFVIFSYPWDEEGTILKGEKGPDTWQKDLLIRIGDKVRENTISGVQDAIREAVASGHGIGKSALVAWIIQWFMSTRPHCQVVVTANTETQLQTKTWREMAKWHKLLINKSWFEWTATQFKSVDHPETWFASAITWSEQRSEAFAGTHERDVLMIFDEASAIPDIIWDTAEGAMTTPGAMWLVFGNMTRAVGRFVDCFERFRHRWEPVHIDSRTAKKANQKQIAEWIADYGEDSDFVRIRVRGVKPRSGSKQFISHETIHNCHQYQAQDYAKFPKVMGVDVARSGDCESVMTVRQGRKVFPQTYWRESDSMQLALLIAEGLRFYRPQLCFVEGNGLGGPIVDRLRQLGWGDVVIEVNPGHRLKQTEEFYNLRAQWWNALKTAMSDGLELPVEPGSPDKAPELDAQLAMQEYLFDEKSLQLKLTPKEELPYSPDRADSLVLTFPHGAVVVQQKDMIAMEELPVLGCV